MIADVREAQDSKIVTVRLNESEMAMIKYWARQWTVAGRSNVRSSGDRESSLYEDQITGQMCNAAFSKLVYGNLHPYNVSRWHAGIHPFASDGGSDIPGTNIDVKGCRLDWSQDPLDYWLLVRPRERYPGNIYVHCVCLPTQDDRGVVHIVGWASEDQLPCEPLSEETHPTMPSCLYGAYALAAQDLHPMMPIRWWGA